MNSKRLFLLVLGTLSFFSCKKQMLVSSLKTDKITDYLAKDSTFRNHHISVALYDPKEEKYIFEKDTDKYFVPASNTKTYTLYAALKTMRDSIPGLKIIERNDTLFCKPTGDPTFLHPDLPQSKVFDFLKNHKAKTLAFCFDHFDNQRLGAGWAWDDYNDDYQVERSAFPIYGNILRIRSNAYQSALSIPAFKNSFVFQSGTFDYIKRDISDNIFYYSEKLKADFKQDIPLKISDQLTMKLLADTLKRDLVIVKEIDFSDAKTVYSMPVDTVLRRMMQVSDNMLAEQTMLMAGRLLTDTLSISKGIKTFTDKHLSDLPKRPNLVDGSGLSRYNLVTANDNIKLLEKLLSEFPQERLFGLMAIGGKTGTLKRYFPANEPPYVYAKTGSMSGVYNMSGYVKTLSGKVLIFSVMNNNFSHSISKVGLSTANLVKFIHENY